MSFDFNNIVNGLSSIGTLIAAFFSYKATKQAGYAVDIAKETAKEDRERANLSLLVEELVNLSERCNSSIGKDSHVIPDLYKIIEMATAVTIAREAIDSTSINPDKKNQLKLIFRRRLRPGVISEIARANSLCNVPSAFTNDVLRKQYSDAQKFLEVNNPLHLVEPRVQR